MEYPRLLRKRYGAVPPNCLAGLRLQVARSALKELKAHLDTPMLKSVDLWEDILHDSQWEYRYTELQNEVVQKLNSAEAVEADTSKLNKRLEECRAQYSKIKKGDVHQCVEKRKRTTSPKAHLVTNDPKCSGCIRRGLECLRTAKEGGGTGTHPCQRCKKGKTKCSLFDRRHSSASGVETPIADANLVAEDANIAAIENNNDDSARINLPSRDTPGVVTHEDCVRLEPGNILDKETETGDGSTITIKKYNPLETSDVGVAARSSAREKRDRNLTDPKEDAEREENAKRARTDGLKTNGKNKIAEKHHTVAARNTMNSLEPGADTETGNRFDLIVTQKPRRFNFLASPDATFGALLNGSAAQLPLPPRVVRWSSSVPNPFLPAQSRTQEIEHTRNRGDNALMTKESSPPFAKNGATAPATECTGDSEATSPTRPTPVSESVAVGSSSTNKDFGIPTPASSPVQAVPTTFTSRSVATPSNVSPSITPALLSPSIDPVFDVGQDEAASRPTKDNIEASAKALENSDATTNIFAAPFPVGFSPSPAPTAPTEHTHIPWRVTTTTGANEPSAPGSGLIDSPKELPGGAGMSANGDALTSDKEMKMRLLQEVLKTQRSILATQQAMLELLD